MPPKNSKIAPKEKPPAEDLAILDESMPSDEEIQAPISTPKPKRKLTQQQIDGLAKGREIAHQRRMMKDLIEKKAEAKKIRQQAIDEAKKVVEDKLIKTAVVVKKRQLAQEKRLSKFIDKDEEEIPDEVIKKIIKEKKTRIQQPQPQQYHTPPSEFDQYYFL